MNNAVESAKGVGGNIQFSSSFSTWGGTLQVKPIDWYYLKVGPLHGLPTMPRFHGQSWTGFRRFRGRSRPRTACFSWARLAIHPEDRSLQLPGKYAFGGFYYGGQRNSFNGTDNYGQWGLYWQVDQMLFREPSPEEPAPLSQGALRRQINVSDREILEGAGCSLQKPKLSKQGLYLVQPDQLRAEIQQPPIPSTSSRASFTRVSSRPATTTS